MAASTRPRVAVTVVGRRAPRAPRTIELEVLAREAGLHPDLVRRFVSLGLLDPVGGTARSPRFPRDAAAQLARAARLRRDLGIDYGGAVLASQLLARIDELEERLRRLTPPTDQRPR